MPMTLEQMFLLGLATWRISNFLSNERGPFAIFNRLRARFGFEDATELNGDKTQFLKDKSNEIGQLLDCPKCTSVWVALLLLLLWWLLPGFTYWLSLLLSLSALACVLNRYVEE